MTQEQMAYLREHYADTKNNVLADKFGCTRGTIVRHASAMGLAKNAEFISKIRTEALEKAVARTKAMGGNSGMRNLVTTHRYKAGHKQWQNYTDAERKAILAKRGAAYKRTYDAEKRRVLFGLPQKTKIQVVCYSKQKRKLRASMRELGYKITKNSKNVLITRDTQCDRSMEAEAVAMGMYVMQAI